MSLPPPFVLKAQTPTITETGESILFEQITDMDGAVEFFKAKIKINEEIPDADDGIYSWLLKEGGLIMAPVESNQESGSVHANLWSWTPTLGKVIAAGELEKNGNEVSYNLKSGSFMKPWLRKESDQAAMTYRVNSKINSLGLRPFFLRCSIKSKCRQGYETLSGKSIISERNIITPISLVFFYRQFFKEKPDDNSESFYSNHSNNLEMLKEGGYSGKKRATRRKSISRKTKTRSRKGR